MKNIFIITVLIIISGCAAADGAMQEKSNQDIQGSHGAQDAREESSESVENSSVTEESVDNTMQSAQIRAPEIIGLTNWINSEPILSLEELRGEVVLIDFWTYGCINCIRTLSHVQALYEKYGNDGFVILGLHAPEFAYERKIENVRKEVLRHGLTYPIAQDNDFATWRNYNNRYWPAHYLIDKKGNIRHTHFGEGAYQEMSEWVSKLLQE